ncbi:MAG: 3-oxoacyl-[acyl-carrier-protein] synthase-3, partial [Kiritimatiellia bacterium]
MTVAIHGLGVHLPPQIRTNDWWPAEIVDRWMAARQRRAHDPPPDNLTAGQRLVLEAMASYADDPFNGSTQRHVLAADQLPSDMQVLAAREAMERADVGPTDVDFVLEYSTCPDYLLNPNSCVVHSKLGLPSRCLTLSMHGECNAFMHQMHLAQRLLASGYRRGLLLQSATLSRIVSREAPFSPWCGDGATAVVVGPPQREGQGLIADAHRTDSSLHTGLVAGVRGASFWTDTGKTESCLVGTTKTQGMGSKV